ncbi:MAG: deoxyribodipyrimidine photolyase [Deltaproteobacteria bacterium]|nr:deoxyribodipyrimidine photolyase [Deltaproteobacteria bacterium]
MPAIAPVPAIRIDAAVPTPARRGGRYVLYWMTAARRLGHNHALQRALAWCEELGKPLVVFEPLRVDYPYASDRFHRFVIEGMAEHASTMREAGFVYLPFVEREQGGGKGLLEALARDACVVVGDDFPAFFLPHMRARAASMLSELGVRFEVVDSCGLLPLRASPSAFNFAHQFRRFVQKTLPAHFDGAPMPTPLTKGVGRGEADLVASVVRERYRFATDDELGALDALIAALPIDHTIGGIDEHGGEREGRARMKRFVAKKLARYHEDRSHPDDDVASGLSSWLHFGHVSSHEILAEVARATDWDPSKIAKKPHGSREGWWNASDAADGFLDELVTWRELGFARCHHTDDFTTWEGIPAWARQTLAEHRHDRRPALYTVDQLDRGETDNEVWNAAQRELRETGRIQNYLRMVWGKTTLNWFDDPRDAFEALIHLNDKYAIDGRDPNTYTNIGWVFGAYDRAWGPERKIFGKVRYMTSGNTVKKLRMKDWLSKWSDGPTRSTRGTTLSMYDD